MNISRGGVFEWLNVFKMFNFQEFSSFLSQYGNKKMTERRLENKLEQKQDQAEINQIKFL